MSEAQDRRAVRRTPLAERPFARVRGVREVRLLDLSLAGAQIEHLAVLRLGATCALELPYPFEPLSLPARVVWCAVVGRKRKFGGDSHLVVRSGLCFTPLTGQQYSALANTLQDLTTAWEPIA